MHKKRQLKVGLPQALQLALMHIKRCPRLQMQLSTLPLHETSARFLVASTLTPALYHIDIPVHDGLLCKRPSMDDDFEGDDALGTRSISESEYKRLHSQFYDVRLCRR
jgi:hypothetical protein